MEVSGQLHALAALHPKIPRHLLDRRLGVPTADLDTVSKRKIPSPHRGSNPDHPIVQPVA
jgi:hypothetical protein